MTVVIPYAFRPKHGMIMDLSWFTCRINATDVFTFKFHDGHIDRRNHGSKFVMFGQLIDSSCRLFQMDMCMSCCRCEDDLHMIFLYFYRLMIWIDTAVSVYRTITFCRNQCENLIDDWNMTMALNIYRSIFKVTTLYVDNN